LGGSAGGKSIMFSRSYGLVCANYNRKNRQQRREQNSRSLAHNYRLFPRYRFQFPLPETGLARWQNGFIYSLFFVP